MSENVHTVKSGSSVFMNSFFFTDEWISASWECVSKLPLAVFITLHSKLFCSCGWIETGLEGVGGDIPIGPQREFKGVSYICFKVKCQNWPKNKHCLYRYYFFYSFHLKEEILCMPRDESENLLLTSQQFKNIEPSCIHEFACSSYSTPEITVCKMLERPDS